MLSGTPVEGIRMTRSKTAKSKEPESGVAGAPAHRVRLPGFLLEEEIGLGDVVKRVTYGLGIEPCGGCEKRAAVLNRWIHFTP